jgi:polyphosphate kinase
VLEDTVNAHELLPDGRYVRVRPAPGEQPFDSQAWFLTHTLFTPDLDARNTTTSALPSGA